MVQEATWSIGVGVLIFIIAVIVAIIYYLRYRKLFLVIFISSIATYTFSVFYFIDVFDLNKNLILLILLISTILSFILAKYFSKIDLKKIKVPETKGK